MFKKVLIGRKPALKRRRNRLSAVGLVVGEKDYCSKPLTAQSQARARKAKQDGTLSMLEGELFCECGERVGARRRPWMDGSLGGPLAPTLHYPREAPLPPARKRGTYKRINR